LVITVVRSFFFSFLAYFLTPAGVVVMALLDASLVFFLPLGIDFVVIVMAARKPHLFWLYALLAAGGSAAGAAGTFWIGKTVGERGLSKLVKPRRLHQAKARVQRGAPVVAALALIPPPFPFTPFVLASGALEMNAWPFLSSLAAFRALRFGVEAGLAAAFGSQILRWMKTSTFQAIVGVLIALAVIGTIVSAVLVVRGTRRAR
jgi:membrane protein YqaA with SNARE-associated domain